MDIHLKTMDIEGAEWNSLKDISEETLLKFKYYFNRISFYEIKS